MDNNYGETVPDKDYPNEATISEAYRILEGFDAIDDSAQMTSRLTIADFIQATTKPSDDTEESILSDFGTFVCVLLVSSLTLWFGLSQLSAHLRQVTHNLPLYPTEMAWPTNNF